MKTFFIVVTVIIILFILFIILGLKMEQRKIKRLLEERDNLNLTTLHGRTRLKVLNDQINAIYDYN